MDISTSHSTLTTIGGWVVILAISGAIWYRSQQKKTQRTVRRGSFTKQSGRQPDTDLVSDTKKKVEKVAKPKPKPKAPTTTTTSNEPTTPNVNFNRDEDEATSKKADREFARQLSNAHAGTKFNTKKSDDKKQKSVKQSKAQEIQDASGGKASVPSSHADDADDDLSSQASPVVKAVDSRDVSDMLEPVASGPSVLRLTGVDSVKPKERKQKAPEVVETKKQRQHRKKAQAAKAAREEEEKERLVKLEQQRRTARIAEGRPAKDGSSFMASAQNAWNEKPTNNSTVQPLDTFEQQPKVESTKPSTVNTAGTTKKSDPWLSGMPSEEEQMELLRQENSWNEVKTKKKGKKKDASADVSAPSAPATNGRSATSTPTVKAPVPVNGTKKPILTSSNSSFAALTPEETDDNEEEKEWDV
ncbi:hypothetical protein F5Y00DRAFT_226292 [Daldinia vernicosa]|uniref:uncharacterized protein n=1 Tax=Daldinia vernicosa TaxID=114800 RepID=UPI0020073E4B|nr:uncharacterized protein F5Y00DRAFT_226292 [Daldinia vernicosa]KAI0852886.1 hypothetical protein F5Y00DRAFT_226292 [Daldinia vernicosa]